MAPNATRLGSTCVCAVSSDSRQTTAWNRVHKRKLLWALEYAMDTVSYVPQIESPTSGVIPYLRVTAGSLGNAATIVGRFG